MYGMLPFDFLGVSSEMVCEGIKEVEKGQGLCEVGVLLRCETMRERGDREYLRSESDECR